jgi:DNA-binding beta-propeller fold protein YncE
VDVSPGGAFSLFAQINPTTLPGPCPGGVGLTTALAVLQTGWVIVGSLPTVGGNSATAQAGCLIVLDSYGNPVETFYGSLINGPWDMTALDGGNSVVLFVTNVLNGTVAAGGQLVNQGAVVRMHLAASEKYMPTLLSLTVIGTGFPERTDPNALVIGPTGVALSPNCHYSGDPDCWTVFGETEPALYVADTLNNRIAVIDHPLTRWTPVFLGRTLTSGGSLNAPLGLTSAPDGHLIAVNGDDGYATEITPQGNQIAKKLLDNTGGPPPGNGALFGVLFDPEEGLVFVDDSSNSLNKLQ